MGVMGVMGLMSRKQEKQNSPAQRDSKMSNLVSHLCNLRNLRTNLLCAQLDSGNSILGTGRTSNYDCFGKEYSGLLYGPREEWVNEQIAKRSPSTTLYNV